MPKIAIIGDFSEASPTHQATSEELAAAGASYEWMATDCLPDPRKALDGYDGLFFAPGGPFRNPAGALAALTYAREEGVPTIATCGGFQLMVIEAARSLLGIVDAEHAETAPGAANLAITRLPASLSGKREMVKLTSLSTLGRVYNATVEDVPYFCSYGVNQELEKALIEAGFVIAARDRVGQIRALELPSHPFYLGTLFVFQAAADEARPHPLTLAFRESAKRRDGTR
jgi:CTP synthase (UTP-ammonia lyase)